MNFIADFGDPGVIGPSFLTASLVLLAEQRRREAAIWGLALACCAVIIFALKATVGSAIDFSLFGLVFRSAAFPSGHAGLSLAFYGGFAALIWRGAKGWFGRALAAAFVVLYLAIVAAVFLLGWHPLLDIGAGILIGTLSLRVSNAVIHARPRGRFGLAPLLLAVLMAIAATHGWRIDDRKLSQDLFRAARAEPGRIGSSL